MNYCPHCGVILADDAETCPLCGATAVQERPSVADAGAQAYPPVQEIPDRPASIKDLSSFDRRRIALELLSLTFGIALIVTVLANLFLNKTFSWSRYSAVIIIGAWLASAMPLILVRRPWLLFSVLAPSLLVLVFALDAFNGHLEWFLGYGLPITALLAGTLAGMGAILAGIHLRGLNTLSIILCAIAIFCVGLEVVIDLNHYGQLSFDWSVVVAFALIPTAVILFYLHYRIVNKASLKKLFRL
ncbi:MAG: zinc-ribbon domain-containing protein [Spirochaetota bacterium]